MFSVNRVVAFLTPVFSAGAAVGAAWLVKHCPGLPTPGQAELLGAEISGATAAAGAALKWLHGHQSWEKRVAELNPLRDIERVVKTVRKLDPKIVAEIEAIATTEINKTLAGLVQAQATAGRPAAAVVPAGGGAA